MFNYVKQTEMNRTEPSVPQPSSSETEIPNEQFKNYIIRYQYPAELTQVGENITFQGPQIYLLYLEKKELSL
jgi:hypothetical protein